MAKQLVNIGASPNDGTGDPLRDAMDKINDNINEIYNAIGNGDELTDLVNVDGEIQALGEANKISFWYEALTDLPNSILNQGALAYVENEAAVYYSHGSQGWKKLLSDNSAGDILGYQDSLPTYPGVGGGGGSTDEANAYSMFAVAGEDNIVAATSNSMLTFVAGNNITLTANAASESITIEAAGGASGGNAFGTIRVAGATDVVADTQGDVLNVANGAGILLSTNATNDTLIITSSGSGGGGVGLTSRSTAQVTAANIADTTTSYQNIIGFKGYALLKIEVDTAAWVRIYTDTAARTADASRPQLEDPTPDSGVIAEVVTAGAEVIRMSPGVVGFNNESTPNTNIPIAITNLSGGLASITVTLTLIQLEA